MFQHTSDGYSRGYVSFADSLLYFFIFFLSLQLAKIKYLLLQNCFNILLMATAGGMWALPTLCYILSIFLSLKANFLLQIAQLLWKPESSNFVYTFRVAKYIVGQKTKLRFIWPYFTFLAHLSQRLTRWAYSIAMVRRPSVVVRRLSSSSSTLSNLYISEANWPT